MLQIIILTAVPFFLSGCAPLLLAPVTVAGAAAEHKTGKSPISAFFSKLTGDDCDLKRIFKADYPCKSETQLTETNKSEVKKEKP
jgi:hypothetical protein